MTRWRVICGDSDWYWGGGEDPDDPELHHQFDQTFETWPEAIDAMCDRFMLGWQGDECASCVQHAAEQHLELRRLREQHLRDEEPPPPEGWAGDYEGDDWVILPVKEGT